MINYIIYAILAIPIIVVYKIFEPILIALYYKLRFGSKVYLCLKPITGVQAINQESHQKHHDSMKYLDDIIEKNPNTKPYIMLCDPDYTKQFFSNFKNYRKMLGRLNQDHLELQGLSFLEGGAWKHSRNVMNPAFNFNTLREWVPMIKKSTVRQLSKIKDGVVEIEEIFHALINEITFENFFGMPYEEVLINGKPICQEMIEIQVEDFTQLRESWVKQIKIALFDKQAANFWITKKDKEIIERINKLRSYARKIIEDRVALQKKDPQKEYIDVLGILVKNMINQKPDDKFKIGVEDIIDKFFNLFNAAIDTTASLMSFACYAILKYPETEKKLRQEINANFKNFDDIQGNDLSSTNENLKYLNYFIKEVLRLWPPGPRTLTRVSAQDHKILDIPIKKNWYVQSCMGTIQRNEKYFKNAKEFDPMRWEKEKEMTINQYQFTPFSSGTRNCIGQHFAMMEAKIFLVYLLKNFEFSENPDIKQYNFNDLPVYYLQPKNFLKIKRIIK